MSAKELDRFEIISRVVERRLTQRRAADRLGLGLRQVERLCRAFRAEGATGLVSRKRGRTSNRKLAATLQAKAVEFIRKRYADFGPTPQPLAEPNRFDQFRDQEAEVGVALAVAMGRKIDLHAVDVDP